MPNARTTTRLGKTIGSVKTPLQSFTYWPQTNRSGDTGYIVVAPSGARLKWFASESDAKDEVARENEAW